MNRVLIGILSGIVFGIVDVLITIRGGHTDVSRSLLMQAFFSRLAVGILAANNTLPPNAVVAGALAGLLISLPDAVALKSYAGVLGTGLVFGALAGWAAQRWGA